MDNRISIGQLRQNPTEMVRAVKRGATYLLTDRGEPIADIAPHRADAWRSGTDVGGLLAQLGPDPSWETDAAALRTDEAPRNPWDTATGR